MLSTRDDIEVDDDELEKFIDAINEISDSEYRILYIMGSFDNSRHQMAVFQRISYNGWWDRIKPIDNLDDLINQFGTMGLAGTEGADQALDLCQLFKNNMCVSELGATTTTDSRLAIATLAPETRSPVFGLAPTFFLTPTSYQPLQIGSEEYEDVKGMDCR